MLSLLQIWLREWGADSYVDRGSRVYDLQSKNMKLLLQVVQLGLYSSLGLWLAWASAMQRKPCKPPRALENAFCIFSLKINSGLLVQAQEPWDAQGGWLGLITVCTSPHVLSATCTRLPYWLLPSALTSAGINSCVGLCIWLNFISQYWSITN